MSDRGTVTINGQEYDAVSGLPITEAKPQQAQAIPAPTPTKPVQTSTTKRQVERVAQPVNPHGRTQRSTTLNRKFTKKPTPIKTTIARHHPEKKFRQDIQPVAHTVKPSVIQPSPAIRKFAPHPVGATKPLPATKAMDIAPVSTAAPSPVPLHPHVAKAHAKSAAKQAKQEAAPVSATIPAEQIKQHTVTQAVHQAAPNKKEHRPKFWQQKQRVTGVIAATFAIVLLGGYFTYLNMPNLSVRVAAAQAGINASYPSYRPDGYALNGPITYSNGRVSMNFKSNSGDKTFTVNQSKSSWNSDAVLDNYVTPRAGESYMPYTERGLTIYTYNNNAAWVNGGILYTIEGDAPLSGEQIRQIATSLL